MRNARIVLAVMAGLMFAGGCAPPERPAEPFWNQELLLRIYLDGLMMIHPELTLDYRLNTPADQQQILDDIERNKQLARRRRLSEPLMPPELMERLERLMVRRLQDYHRRRECQPTRAEVEQYYEDHPEEFRRDTSAKGTPTPTESRVPLEQVARSIEIRLFRERVEEQKAVFLERAMAEHDVEILVAEDLIEAPPPDSPVYRIDGRTVTYEDILNTHSNVYGDRASVEFFQALMKRALQDELLFLSPEADQLRQSREYQFLHEAFEAQWKVLLFLRQEYERNPITEEELRQYYEEHREQLYPAPAETKLIVVSLPKSPEPGPGSADSATEARSARESLEHIHRDFVASASPGAFSFAAYRDTPGLQVTRLEEWTPVHRLGRLIEMDIAGRKPGETSPILASQSAFLFYHLLDRREGGYLPFEEVRPGIELSLRQARMREIRAEFQAD